MINMACSQTLASTATHPVQQSLQCVRNKGLSTITLMHTVCRSSFACYVWVLSLQLLAVFLFIDELLLLRVMASG